MEIKGQVKQIVNSYNETVLVVEGVLVFVDLKEIDRYIDTSYKDVLNNYTVHSTSVPIIISETEPIQGGDLVYDIEFKNLHTVNSRYTITDFDRKVLVSPFNFTSKQIGAILKKKLNQNDIVFIKCITSKLDQKQSTCISFNNLSDEKITLVRNLTPVQFSKKRVEEIANWAFSFHRREDLDDEELEKEYRVQLELKLLQVKS